MARGLPAPGLTLDHPADVQGAVAEASLVWLWTTGAGVLIGGLLGAWIPSPWLLAGLVVWASGVAAFAVGSRAPRCISTRVTVGDGQLVVRRMLGPLALSTRRTSLRTIAEIHVSPTGSLTLTLRSGDRWVVPLPHLPASEVARVAATILRFGQLPDHTEPWRALERQRSQLISLLDQDPRSGR